MGKFEEDLLQADYNDLQWLESRDILKIEYKDDNGRLFDIKLNVSGFSKNPNDPDNPWLRDSFFLRIRLHLRNGGRKVEVTSLPGRPAPMNPHFMPEKDNEPAVWRNPSLEDEESDSEDGRSLFDIIRQIGSTISLHPGYIGESQNVMDQEALELYRRKWSRHYAKGLPFDFPDQPPSGSNMPADRDRPVVDRIRPEPDQGVAEPEGKTARPRKSFVIIDQTPPARFQNAPLPQGPYLAEEPFHQPSEETPRLFIEQQAMGRIKAHIHWARATAGNMVEQGGLLLGRVFCDESTGQQWTKVVSVVEALSAQGSSAYLSMDHGVWKSMMDRIDHDAARGIVPSDLLVVGWYHTHPNHLPVFMSSTDQRTQRCLFFEDWHFAVVLNPQRKLCRVFVGAGCEECRAVILEAETAPRHPAC